jgi:HEAT repeat protein
MSWLIGGRQGEAKKLIALLSDSLKRDNAARDLIKLGGDAVPLLMEALQTQDPGLLLIYQQILSRIPSASTALTKSLATAHPVIRARAAETLGIGRDKASLPALLDALNSEFILVRSRAAIALGSIGDVQAVPGLLLLLKDREDEARSAACHALGMFRDPFTFDELANVLLDDPKIEVRQSAATALGDTKHPAAIPFLMEALRDSFWWFEREQAIAVLLTAIEKMGTAVVEPLIHALGDREATVRRFAAIVLGGLRDPRAMEELAMLQYDLHHEVGKAAADALAKFGAQAVDILIESLGHPEPGIRENGVIALGNIQDARVAPVLIEMLGDPDREIQKQALHSLGQINDRGALSALQEVAANRADRELAALAKKILDFGA